MLCVGIRRRSFIPEAGLLRREPGRAGGRRRELAPLPARGVRRAAPAAGQLRAADTDQDEHDLGGPSLQSVSAPETSFTSAGLARAFQNTICQRKNRL